MRRGRPSRRVRKFLGQRLRALRRESGWSQEGLGKRAGLSGKFIGEVERGEKSISVVSLYGISTALKVPLNRLTDMPANNRPVPTEDAERVIALLLAARTPHELHKAYRVIRSLFRPPSEV